jgi:hypothetical protein
MASRRLFMGSLAAAGVGAVGGVSLLDFPAAAQPAASSPLIREMRRQLKQALGKMQNGASDGAKQAATIMRVYAATVDDGQLRAALRKADRSKLLYTEMKHGELAKRAVELGINPAILPQHFVDSVGREAALNRLRAEGLSPLMRQLGDVLDDVAGKLQKLEQSGRAGLMQVALRQPIPDESDCGDCNTLKAQTEGAQFAFEVICVAMVAFPALAPLCEAAALAFFTFYAAWAACQLYVTICQNW